MRIYTTNKALAVRAHRALKYAHHNKVFLLGGEFWLVTRIHHNGLGYEIHLTPARAKARDLLTRSIDDCSVAEWKRATARAVPQSWYQWCGGACPVEQDRRVDVIYRGSAIVDRDLPAGARIWQHVGAEHDIVWWRVHRENK